jgi:hypothetical protein
MQVYNYSEARHNFSTVLNVALKEDVIIARRDGSRFKLMAVEKKDKKSPLDIPGIKTDITMQEIVAAVREVREVSEVSG